MTTAAASPVTCQGARQIVRFNWPSYVAGAACVTAATLLATLPAVPGAGRLVLGAAAAVAGYWLAASLVVSHWVYDRSPLFRWAWLEDVLDAPPRRWANLHAGFDVATPAVRRMFPSSQGRVLDFFDAAEMTEPSIRRARRLAPTGDLAEPVDAVRLPLVDGELDAGLLLLSAHELRRHGARASLLGELRRALRPGGQVVLAEHLRDLPNFLAFGPGFLHFHSRRSWRRAVADAGLAVERELRITPFVAVLVLRRP